MQARITPLRIALFIGLLLSAMDFRGCLYLELVDVRAVDYRLKQRGPRPAGPEVVIVAIDDPSLEAVGRWPWSRGTMAELVDRISAADPAVIGFDVLQSEPTADVDVDELLGRISGLNEATRTSVRSALIEGMHEDQALARSIAASGKVVLGYFFDFNVEPSAPPDRFATYDLVRHQETGAGESHVIEGRRAVTNLSILNAGALDVGFVNIFPDSGYGGDGSVRRIPTVIRFGGQMAMPLSLAMLRAYAGGPAVIRFGDFGVQSVQIGDYSIPVAEDGQMLLNYRGRAGAFRRVSALDVLRGRVPPVTFRGKLVLLGVTATAVGDIRVTPFDGALPGVEIHATAIDNILHGDTLWQAKWLGMAEIGVILFCVLLLGLVLQWARGLAGLLVAGALLVAYLAGSQWLFVAEGLPLSLVYPILAISLTYVAISVLHYVVEEREKRETRKALSLYLSPSMAELLSRQPELMKLGGEKRELTVFFSDIRGFTTISEKLAPENLVELLNLYLGNMTDIVFSYDGMLDKYIGDAVMAVWGAPLPQPDHARRACRATLEMLARLEVLNREWQERGWPKLSIGAGINTGPMVFGNMGSAQHLSLTVMGDNVNLGSRLEGLNKMYGTHAIASESTLRAVGDVAVARDLDLVRVKGKHEPVRIFELLAMDGERDRWAPLLESYGAGIEAYRQRRFADARASFAAVLASHPDDGPAKLYVERCEMMAADPPAPDWDGVTVMKTK
jgi:adenylate cyclase